MSKQNKSSRKFPQNAVKEPALSTFEEGLFVASEGGDGGYKSTHSINDLHDYFAASNEGIKKTLPKERQRYVIYTRKSTDDESKQVRSLADQKKECLKIAQNLKVRVRDEDIFEESASAKVSGNRPVFDKMLLGFRAGKYHGLISWSPDRISRNMKEAGEVIEMIDQEEIQSLYFATYHFDNSPNGKMMLGILFATSKQYSDKLAVDVKRGTDGNTEEGRYNGSLKKGYYIEESTGYFVPDAPNWFILRQAVDMRLQDGKTYDEIASFVNKKKLTERKRQDGAPKPVKMTKQKVRNIFADPFYCGLYRHGDSLANLTERYNFTPLITADEYIQLNADVSRDFDKPASVRTNRNQRLGYGLLNGKVICEYCDHAMKFQHHIVKRGKNTGKWVVSFYCNNKVCLRHNKQEQKNLGIKLAASIRAKYVLAGIEWQLRHLTKKSAQAYRMYKDTLQVQVAADRAIAKRKLTDARRSLREHEKQYATYQDFQVNSPKEYKRHHSGKLEEYRELVRLDEVAIADNEATGATLSAQLPTEAEFYELINSKVLDMLSTSDIVALDMICNEFVVNLRAGNNATSVIQLKKPYDSMVDLDKISLGSGGRI